MARFFCHSPRHMTNVSAVVFSCDYQRVPYCRNLVFASHIQKRAILLSSLLRSIGHTERPSQFDALDHLGGLSGGKKCSYDLYNHVKTSYRTLSDDVNWKSDYHLYSASLATAAITNKFDRLAS